MNTDKSPKVHYLYMDYLRVISVLAVIVIHVSGANWFRIDIGSANWIVQTFFNIGGRFSVCVFCMISGALLLSPGKRISKQNLFIHYIGRILICLISWIILYALFYTVLNHEGPMYFVSRLFELPDHLWYLFMLIGMYLAYPAIRQISKNRDVTLYLIWLILALDLLTLISGTTGHFSTVAENSTVYPLWRSFLGNLGDLKCAFVPGYLACFLLGHYIHEYGLGKWHKLIVRAAIPALLLSSLLTIWLSILSGKYVYNFMLESNPLVILASAGIFAFFRGPAGSEQIKRDPQTSKIMVWLGQNVFGIYLIHFSIREFFSQVLNFNVASLPALISVPLISILIFIISLVLTVLLRKVPLIKKIMS